MILFYDLFLRYCGIQLQISNYTTLLRRVTWMVPLFTMNMHLEKMHKILVRTQRNIRTILFTHVPREKSTSVIWALPPSCCCTLILTLDLYINQLIHSGFTVKLRIDFRWILVLQLSGCNIEPVIGSYQNYIYTRKFIWNKDTLELKITINYLSLIIILRTDRTVYGWIGCTNEVVLFS